MTFKVSVVIPVYNAEKYLERAIRSALDQAEVAEVLVVDDGYPDNSIEIIKTLAKHEERVKLLQHPRGENRGAGASRNLALSHVSCEFVALLDADDYFLHHRFKYTKKTFLERPEVTAIYEPVATEFADEESKEGYAKLKGITISDAESHLSYPLKPLEGVEFLNTLLDGSNGSPCTDGITFRESALKKAGTFNESLRLHQDTDFFIKLAYTGYFSSAGHNNPVAIRYGHAANRITKRKVKDKFLFHDELNRSLKNMNGVSNSAHKNIRRKYWQFYLAYHLGLNGLLLAATWRLVYFIRR